MSSSPRIKLLAVCIGAALAQMASLPVLADSGAGVDTVIGNIMNPGYPTGPARQTAETEVVKRTPSGQMYGFAPAAGDASSDGKIVGSVEFGYLHADDQKRYSKRNEYSDPENNGLYLNNFSLSTEAAAKAYFLSINGGGVGKKDQFYDLSVGQYNSWKVKAFFNETPHVFSDTFRPLYIDNGTGKPTLNNGAAGAAPATSTCVRGATVAATNQACTVDAYLATQPLTEVAIVRKKGGVRGDVNLTDNWKAYASVSQEKRDGERPFGIRDSNVEGIEPIRHETTDWLAGLQYNDGLTAANLRASASQFRNSIDYLFNPKPLSAITPAPTTFGTMDYSQYTLAPDNVAYNVKGEVSRKLPDFFKGRISAAVAYGTSRQNDAIRTPLRPNDADFTSASIVQAAAQGVTFNPNNWNGVNGSPTSRATAGQRIDTELLNLALTLNPLDALNVKGSYRHYATKNKSGTYYAYNPLTGQWGYGNYEGAFNSNAPIAASGGTGCQPAPGFTIPVGGCTTGAVLGAGDTNRWYSSPMDNKQDNAVLSADYDLGHGSLEGALEREDFKHTYRERDKTWEDKIKLGYVNTGFEQMTLRASYENDRKRGSLYDPELGARTMQNWFAMYGIPYSRSALLNLISQAGPAAVNNIPALATVQAWTMITGNNNTGNGFMKTDQADRDQNILNGRVNYMAREDLDIGVNVQVKRVKYPSNIRGVQKDDLNTYNFDANYQPAVGTQFTAYYTRQDGRQRQVDNYGAGSGPAIGQTRITPICGATLTANNLDCYLNNSLNPDSDVTVDTSNTNDILGFGYQQDIGQMRLGIDYTYSMGKSHITQAYGPTALTTTAVAPALSQTAIVGLLGGYPDMTTKQNTLAANLLVPITKQWSSRIMYRYEEFKVQDWHYDYYSATPPGTFIPGDLGPQNYRVNTVGVMLDYKM